MADTARRQTVLELLAEGHRLVDGINAHIAEIEELLDLDSDSATGTTEGSSGHGP